MEQSLEERVEILEKMMANANLQDLPGQMTEVRSRLTSVESQIVQLHREMNAGFSATKAEMHKLNDETKAEMRHLNDETKAEMRKLNKETMAQARVLYEDLKDTVKKIGEGLGWEPN